MELISKAPIAVATMVWQPRAGAFCSTVICKATHKLEPGVASLSQEQDPVREVNVCIDGGNLLFASDMAPFKPRADIVLVGSAFAPGGVPTRGFTARLCVGGLDKSIDVQSDRALTRDGLLHQGPSFWRMPLFYERTHGGPGTWNPVGIRRDAWTEGPSGTLKLPNLTVSNSREPSPRQMAEPAGLGPIPPSWPLRHARLGLHEGFGEASAWSREVAPVDFNFGFFNIAPLDQQVAEIDDEATILLENLHAKHPRLSTRLPGLCPSARLEQAGKAMQPIPLRLDTLWIDTDRAVCLLTYRGQVMLTRPDEPGRIIVELPEEPNNTVRIPTASAAIGVIEDEPTHFPSSAAKPALPFVERSPPAAAPFFSIAALVAVAEPPLVIAKLEPVAPPRGELPVTPAKVEARPATSLSEGEALDLLWLAKESIPRIRRRRAWRDILNEVEERAIDPELDDPELSATPATVENRRDVTAILVRAEPLGPEPLREILAEGISDGGFTAKIALAAGELLFAFDEVKLLEALVATVTPLAADDERLRGMVKAANDFLGTRGAASLPGVAEGLSAQIKEALRQGRRAQAFEGLNAQVERSALEQRAYQRRSVFGGLHLRGAISLGSGATAPGVPVYFPEALAMGLPMAARFKARILGEVHPQVDQGETHGLALRAVALGRVVSFTLAATRR